MFSQRPDLAVVTSSDSGLDVQNARHANPDVVLVDLGLRHQAPLRIVETVKKASPGAGVIIMDLLPVQEDVVEFVRAGVSGFILKDAPIDDFVRTIRAVAEGTFQRLLVHRIRRSGRLRRWRLIGRCRYRDDDALPPPGNELSLP